jgi:hypothetical protein
MVTIGTLYGINYKIIDSGISETSENVFAQEVQ